MRKVGLSLLFSAIALYGTAQDVLTIANNNISLEEFKNVFYKNNHNADINKSYLDEYMQLFINFKLKVREAEELKMDTIPSFINELEGYKKQLAKPYLRNKEFDENMIIEAYNRMLKDVKASHILISIDEKATEKEHSLAYEKALSIRTKILSQGISFANAAKKYSDDKSALSNGGGLSYFTVFMMVYDFETAAYNTNIGELSMPVKTKYGYHIIKVDDIRDAVGQVQVAHIMFKTGEGADEKRLSVAKEKINQVLEKLNAGEDFADVAERFSEDKSTAVKGGRLPAFGVGKMVPEFEDVAFKLQEIGEVSQPFRTEFGWHIITLLSKERISDLETIKPEIKKKIERDSRGELSRNALYAKLKEEYKIVNKVSVFSALRKLAVKKVNKGSWDGQSTNIKEVLFTINTMPILVNDFIDYILANQIAGSDFDKMYQNFVNERVLVFEESQLQDKYPEYKALLNEYREGILLFDLTNKKVWTKAVEDTIGLQGYFKENLDKYKWENRVDATIYTCTDFSTARKVKTQLFKKKFGLIVTSDEILELANAATPLSLQIQSKKFTKGDNKYIDSVDWKVGISPDIKLDDGSIIVIEINELLDATNKALNETRGKVISDYQTQLETEWISKLRKKYTISINNTILYSLIK
ncbi:peptidylprolyl isomerase [Flavobacteriales bacterium]|nr:peptidylprolyl isomerase [Flavobacteriales bacterium]